jgi:hypothetical protein
MIKINNEKELEYFLRKIANKSLTESVNHVFEDSDPYIKNFQNNLANEMERLTEQEEEEEEAEEEEAELPEDEEELPEEEAETGDEAEESDVKNKKDDEPKPKTNFAAEKALELIDYQDDFDVSFENVVTALNTLRAGKSTKNKDIQSELSSYYERLSGDERAIMLLYLNELSKVITGATSGADAQDPSDPSTYFNITRNKSQSRASSDNREEQQDQAQQAPVDQQKQGEEDTTPPIKVNESQDLSLEYRKFKLLMKG